jgi:hypothetical protein
MLSTWVTSSRTRIRAGALGVEVLDEGTSLGIFKELNFTGTGVLAVDVGVPDQVSVLIPPAVAESHWNTNDGASPQFVTETITRVSARISTPFGGEGVPYETNGWAGTDQDAAQDTSGTYTTPGETTGFGGDSYMTTTVYAANGTTALDTYLTPFITGNGVFVSTSGFIVVTITNYGPDILSKRKANASVAIDFQAILAAAGFTGGRAHANITHKTDSATDGGGSYPYIQPDVFFDYDPNTPAINGTVALAETGGSILTKHLSGLEYYILGSQFTVGVTDIDHHNSNTQRIPTSLVVNAPEYGLPTLNQSPFGTGAGNFVGWTNLNNQQDINYQTTSWAITMPNYRYMGPTGSGSSYPRDPWIDGATVNSTDTAILVDTYVASSTATFEDFDDEARREDPASFPGLGTWNSANALIAGEAIVFNSRVMVPNATTYIRSDGPNSPNADWSTFKPDLGGANPNYTTIGAPANYGRRFTQSGTGNIPSFQILFTGTFAGGNALADLTGGNLEIYVYRIGGLGNTGPPPGNTSPLRVHVPFNFAVWDDGATVPGSGIREGSSSGNTINCTFGTGTPAQTGFYCHVRILNSGTEIDSVTVVFI